MAPKNSTTAPQSAALADAKDAGGSEKAAPVTAMETTADPAAATAEAKLASETETEASPTPELASEGQPETPKATRIIDPYRAAGIDKEGDVIVDVSEPMFFHGLKYMPGDRLRVTAEDARMLDDDGVIED